MEQSVTKRIAKNFSWLLAGNVASGLINFFSIVYIARVLGAANYGLVQLAQAFLLYLVIIVDSGLSTYGTREIARDHDRAPGISINIFALRLVLSLIVFILSSLLVLVIPLGAGLKTLLLITFLLVFYRALNTDWVFQGLEKMEYVALFKLVFAAVSFCFIVILVRQPADLVNVPLVQLVTGILLSLVFVVYLFKRFVPFELGELSLRSWPQAFLIAVPLGISTILMQVYDNLDTIMLGVMDRAAVVGLYNAAYRIFYLFAGVFSLWLATVLPVACKRLSDDPARAKVFLEKYLRLTISFFIPVALFVFLAAPFFIQVVFGPEYGQSVSALRWLIWALIPLVIGNSYGSLVLIPAGLFNSFLVSVGVGALTNIILNLALIPFFSMIGAAIATIIAQVVAGLAAYSLSRRVISLKFAPFLLKPLLVSLLAYAVFALFAASVPFLDATAVSLAGGILFLLVSGALLLVLENRFIFGFVREILMK